MCEEINITVISRVVNIFNINFVIGSHKTSVILLTMEISGTVGRLYSPRSFNERRTI